MTCLSFKGKISPDMRKTGTGNAVSRGACTLFFERAVSMFALAALVVVFCSASFSIEIKIEKELEYAKTDLISLAGDVYRPDSGETLPGLVLAHGGGFIMGNKDWQQMIPVAKRLAEAGYVVFNINYRLSKQGGEYPNNVADVNCAVRWLKAHAEEHGVDKENIGVIGSSAGGYLSLMAGFTSGGAHELSSCPAKDEDSTVKAVVAYYGITDLERFYKDGIKGIQLGKILTGKPLGKARKLYRKASPVNHIDNAPPTLLLHGTVDKLVPFSQSESLYEAMEKKKLDVRLEKFEGAGHGFINDIEGEVGTASHRLSIEFLDLHLKEAVMPEAGE